MTSPRSAHAYIILRNQNYTVSFPYLILIFFFSAGNQRRAGCTRKWGAGNENWEVLGGRKERQNLKVLEEEKSKEFQQNYQGPQKSFDSINIHISDYDFVHRIQSYLK